MLKRNIIRCAFWVAVFASLFSASVSANIITVKYQLNQVAVYDYVTSTYSGTIDGTFLFGTFSFDDSQRTIQSYGQVVITNFGPVLGTVWSSPLTALIPLDPYGGGYGPFYNSYTFPNVSDYPTDFVEQAAAQANTYGRIGQSIAAYHIELRASKYSGPKAGDGSSAYAFTADQLIAFLNEFVDTGSPVYFNESYQVFDFVNGQPMYSEGKDWSSYSAKIVSVSGATPVPESSTLAMFLSGVLVLGAAAHCRKRHTISSQSV